MADLEATYEVTIANVGNVLVEGELQGVPLRGLILRARAAVNNGTAGFTSITWEVREVTAAPGEFDIVLAYSATALDANDRFDSDERPGHFYEVASVAGARGSLFPAVLVDQAATDHDVTVQLTIRDLTRE